MTPVPEGLLKSWRRQLKVESLCPPGCGDCCQRPVLMLYQEWLEMEGSSKFKVQSSRLEEAAQPGCPFRAEEGCSIYARRPLPCRWFGLADLGENCCFRLVVVKGVRARRPAPPGPPALLPAAQVEEIRGQWTLELYRQMAEVMAGRRRNPERLAWLKYCLGIPEGRVIWERLARVEKTLDAAMMEVLRRKGLA